MSTKALQPIETMPRTGSRLDVRLQDLLQRPGTPRPQVQPSEPL